MTRAALTAWIALIALSGCSLGSDDEKGKNEPAAGEAKQVAAAVSALDKAVRAGDWRTVCDRLFTPAARRRAGGRDCVRLVRSSAGDLRGARIELVGIEVSKAGAQAKVRTRSKGQAALTDTLVLKRAGGGYRIDALR
ncbi:MAG TPA: hypothetical protein VGF21_17595 [Thermoleophilaceae bacterium]